MSGAAGTLTTCDFHAHACHGARHAPVIRTYRCAVPEKGSRTLRAVLSCVSCCRAHSLPRRKARSSARRGREWAPLAAWEPLQPLHWGARQQETRPQPVRLYPEARQEFWAKQVAGACRIGGSSPRCYPWRRSRSSSRCGSGRPDMAPSADTCRSQYIPNSPCLSSHVRVTRLPAPHHSAFKRHMSCNLRSSLFLRLHLHRRLDSVVEQGDELLLRVHADFLVDAPITPLFSINAADGTGSARANGPCSFCACVCRRRDGLCARKWPAAGCLQRATPEKLQFTDNRA